MNRLNNLIALISTPSAIYLNIEAYIKSIESINFVLALILSIASLVSIYFVIKKNIYAARIKKLKAERMEYANTHLEYFEKLTKINHEKEDF